ncbi:MAG: LamG domain-containing protein, partial [Planctomycetota bacterium]
GLVPGTTYYWRIDEVNDANSASPWKGNVWSFTVSSKKAYEPYPADGADFLEPDIELSWAGGLNSILHYVFIGESFEEVDAATTGITAIHTNYTPSDIELGKTYFWRVDQFDGANTHKGDVWSFTTLPYVPITDPNLVGWWKFDEGSGVNVLDGSGHGNHGTLKGDPQWVMGPDGDALEFDGVDDWVEVPHAAILTVDNEVTVMAWINTERHIGPTGDDWQGIMSKGNPRSYSLYTQVSGVLHFSTAGVGSLSSGSVPLNEWVHVCAMVIDGAHQYYINGEDAGTSGTGIVLPGAADSATVRIGNARDANREFLGMIDDVRIFNRALTQDEVKQLMQGDPTLSWGPSPAHRSTPDIYNATSLSWSPGDKAEQHDVYFGTDKTAVNDADTTTADIYRGRQATTSYNPPEKIEWGGGPYFWRIDEYNTDGTTSKGNVWSFTVADFILVDDFEDYDGIENQIWFSWLDGLGYGTPGSAGYYEGNGTGSAVGNENTASYMEETIVNGDFQSMPISYDNNQQGYAMYSEVELTLTSPRDWTQQDLAELSLWFRGYPASTGSFTEAPAGTYTMTATGDDIWYSADQFHYAFKTLTGTGSIEAKVISVDNTDPWAKAGVMIRETLDVDSKFAAVYITPGNGCRFQARINTAVDAISDTSVASTEQMAITAPYWVKLERDIAGNF